MLDAGLRNTTDGQAALKTGATRLIAALETLPGPRQLAELVSRFGNEAVVFSLDLKHGVPIGQSEAWERSDPDAIAEQAVTCGVRSMILLDLAAVGEGQGVPTIDLCIRLQKRLPGIELITGGGVRNRDDLHSLADAGSRCSPDRIGPSRRPPATRRPPRTVMVRHSATLGRNQCTRLAPRVGRRQPRSSMPSTRACRYSQSSTSATSKNGRVSGSQIVVQTRTSAVWHVLSGAQRNGGRGLSRTVGSKHFDHALRREHMRPQPM